MGFATDLHAPSLPFPLFKISSKIERFLLYDIDTISWLRKAHNVLGVLIGTLPQFPQQNIFLGLPLQLQPEEARLLVEKNVAYIVDGLSWHSMGMQSMTSAQKASFKGALQRDGKQAAKKADMKREMARENVMKEHQDRFRTYGQDTPEIGHESTVGGKNEDESLFNHPSTSNCAQMRIPTSKAPGAETDSWIITPTTSSPPLQAPAVDQSSKLPLVRSSSYALFKHLHSLGYFLSPGLRFGCQFLVYPGDPLRFHSHFLAVATDWDEEFDLLDLVGGGRLGTGVKKGWLIGGFEEEGSAEATVCRGNQLASVEPNGKVRTFCIEWGGM